MAKNEKTKVIDLNQENFYPVPSFIMGSMLSGKDPVMVGEFWAPEVYEYVSDERMTDSMRKNFFNSCIEAALEERGKLDKEGRA